MGTAVTAMTIHLTKAWAPVVAISFHSFQGSGPSRATARAVRPYLLRRSFQPTLSRLSCFDPSGPSPA